MIYKCEYCKTHTAHSEGMKMECVNCGAALETKKAYSQQEILMNLARQTQHLGNSSMLSNALGNSLSNLSQIQAPKLHGITNIVIGRLF